MRIGRAIGNFVIVTALAIVAFGVQCARGEVVRLQIDQRSTFADGHVFGRSGPYERVSGKMFLEVDPNDPVNACINDVELAPRNARGRVECWTDFFLLKPVDPARGNRRILFDVHNRGNKLALWTFNESPTKTANEPKTLADAGNGFLMREGYTVFWCGWNGDVMEDGKHRLLCGLPVATQNGETITGRIHVEVCVDERVYSRPFYWSPWGTSAAYPSVSLDNENAALTMCPNRSEPAQPIPRDAWSFARLEDGKLVPDATCLYVKEGFRPGWLYDLVYTGKDPRVSGLGLACMRDSVSFLRYAKKDSHGTANPMADAIERAYVFGISQSGRLVHHFIYDGFNTNPGGRIVFDGALIHVSGGGKGLFNSRFGMATVYGLHHQGMLNPSEFFPFTPVSQRDPVTGREGDTFARARAKGHVPKTIFTQTSTEYWSRGASLLHTDVEGKRDLTLDPSMRVYLVSGAQHLGGGSTDRGICQYQRNPLNDRPPVLRAMLVALDRWTSGLGEPPASRYPRIDDGTLVDLATFRQQFPKIPGVKTPDAFYRPRRLDFGPRWFGEGIADIVPPKVGVPYQTFLPAVDADGNELAGIRLPDIAVPTATYTGWNLRAPEYGAGGVLAGLHGGYHPFTKTLAERRTTGDPRPSILERYPTRSVYLSKMTDATLSLQRDGFLLEEDVVRILDKAAEVFPIDKAK